jgi:hypothetical protein
MLQLHAGFSQCRSRCCVSREGGEGCNVRGHQRNDRQRERATHESCIDAFLTAHTHICMPCCLSLRTLLKGLLRLIRRRVEHVIVQPRRLIIIEQRIQMAMQRCKEAYEHGECKRCPRAQRCACSIQQCLARSLTRWSSASPSPYSAVYRFRSSSSLESFSANIEHTRVSAGCCVLSRSSMGFT